MKVSEAQESAKVRHLYAFCFGKPWPKKYVIEWKILASTLHPCSLQKHSDGGIVSFCFGRLLDDPYTVIHELIHVHRPFWPHGKKFNALTMSLYMKAKRRFGWPNR